MPLTKVQVISQSLMRLGKKPITNLLNQSDIVSAASEAFDFLFAAAFSEGAWRFATTIQQLSKNVNIPVGGYWQFSYQLPANYTKLIHLWPHNYDFEIYENSQLYTNLDNSFQPLFIEYQFVPPIQNVPDYFWKYFIDELGAHLALSNAQTVQYYSALMDSLSVKMARAMAFDAQNRPQTPIQSQPALARRFVSTLASG